MKITTTTTRQLIIQMKSALEGVSQWVNQRPDTHPWDAWQRVIPAITAADRWLADAGQPSDLVKRLRDTASNGISVWGDLQMEAAREIEILTAEVELYAAAMDRMKKAAAGPEPDDLAAAMKQKTERLTP